MAVTAFSGSLASIDLIDSLSREARANAATSRLLARALARLGPSSGARQVFDLLLVPLFAAAGATLSILDSSASAVVAVLPSTAAPLVVVAAGGWNADLRQLRRATTRGAPGVRWWIGTNGATIRIVDVTRAHTQRSIDVAVETCAAEETSGAALARLIDASTSPPLETLASLVTRSEQHRAEVGRSLQSGVERALLALVKGFAGRRRQAAGLDAALADALTVVYRILFLLFAEARGLVPQWHPIYRDSYTIESLRPLAEGRRSPAGLWQSLQAIARLAHRGCTAGSLRVVPFNGRLFAPSAAPLAESWKLDDRLVRDVLLAVTTTRGTDRLERISYADLGVEQLGSVYERVLEYTPSRTNGAIAMSTTGRRKRTGTFYTPRAMTEYLVRRTLAPLVRGATPERVLSLRVLDPAMGSGAFVVAACRFLASAYEQALIDEGSVTVADLTPADRAGFRRAVAQRCLFGVDANPTAVQLARLSLWLCTLAADRPLTFLDHHLRTGNSLAGASPSDVTRQPTASARRGRRAPLDQPSLFDAGGFSMRLSDAVGARLAVAREPDDSAAIVRRKERAIAQLEGTAGPLHAWRTLADAWCAGWFWPAGAESPSGAAWPAFASALRGHTRELPPDVEHRWRRTVTEVAAREHFFHWELEFPEVFYTDDGLPRADAGFDAVIGNPPWAAAGPLTRFSRDSGCYTLQAGGHANLYQLFAERMLRLAAPGGRVGMVMPSGLLADVGCADLRRHLFDACAVDAVVSLDNRDALFPIHRGVRFCLVTATTAGRTEELCLKSGVRDAAVLDDVADAGPPAAAVRIPMQMLRDFDGPSRAVPDLISEMDRAVLARMLSAGRPLGSEHGWCVRFGRELNATDDRPHFERTGLPVLEGKLIEPYRVRVEDAADFIDPAVARRLLGRRAAFGRARLGYREVAAAGNRLTLIAAIIPPGAVTTHTIFCLREPLDDERQWFLCGLFNSYVANYCVRLRRGTHVPSSVIHQLPVPQPAEREVREIAQRARRVAGTGDPYEAAVLQAAVAGLYGLTGRELAHVLSTFPLIDSGARGAVLRAAHGI